MSELRGLLAAITFLTRLPLGGRIALDGEDVRRAAASFPLVGAAIGALVGAIAAATAPSLSAPLGAVVAIGAGTLVTGALHLDALADTADALGANGREQALAIMRDSTIGAFGATAIALALALEVAAFAALVRAGDGRAVRIAVAAGALSRAVPVVIAAALPYARADGGTGDALASGGGGVRAAVAGGLALAIAVAVAGVNGAVLTAVALALTLLLGGAYRRWLGGVTGDTLGAALELTETTTLVVAVALAGGR
ncbi:MAG: adenosylcobinamide-GDP ribazoletransferase [Solirubrobacteraceae bacterium]|jgi:adenosylcobinamide-GDP ribazoletransferase